MLNKAGDVIYVGKAKNLKNRVSSYFVNEKNKDLKTRQLVAQIDHIEITVTQNEVEASLLELQLIQQLKPKYNIIFKDDKSYPYICFTAEEYEQVKFYRGHATEAGKFYGPYPSSTAVRETLDLLQKIFKLRTCEKTVFSNRLRPCLQYQIKRCSAPCVDLIEHKTYLRDVKNAQLFLAGESKQVIKYLLQEMDTASQGLNYERAIMVRDQIVALRDIQQSQVIVDPHLAKDIDVLGVYYSGGEACVHVLSIRAGRVLGSKQYFSKMRAAELAGGVEEALAAFITQHYIKLANLQAEIINNPKSKLTNTSINLPAEIVVPLAKKNGAGLNFKTLEKILELKLEKKIKIIGQTLQDKQLGTNYLRWLEIANESAKQAFASYSTSKTNLVHKFNDLKAVLELNKLERIECFDISHTQGEATIGGCVVFDQNGPVRKDYRRYNVKLAAAGDDYAALQEVIQRHYKHLFKENLILPDLLLIDGGKGQLTKVQEVVQALGLTNVLLLGIAKGPTRKPGLETLYLTSAWLELKLEPNSSALHLLQQIRDEAHNLAITTHRAKLGKRLRRSVLEDIPGIGAKRRRDLLAKFGGLQELKQLKLEELEQVPGISKVLAQRIYTALHSSEV